MKYLSCAKGHRESTSRHEFFIFQLFQIYTRQNQREDMPRVIMQMKISVLSKDFVNIS